MAFLMLLHEKMRLQRKQNKLTLKQLSMSGKLDRIKNKISKREKYYSKLQKNLESKANCMKNSMKMQIANYYGLGANQFNLSNPYGGSAAAISILQGWNGTNPFNNQSFNTNEAQAAMLGYYQPEVNEKGVCTGYKYMGGNAPSGIRENLTKEDYQALMQIGSLANSQLTQMQSQCQQVQTNFENQVSIWLQAAQEELEAQQEYEMDLLAEEQNDFEMEKTSIETELESIKARLQALESPLGEGIKDSAPKFGLA